MRNEVILLEEHRLDSINAIDDYDMIHERHRVFPDAFIGRKINSVLDIAAGIGVVGKRIRDNHAADVICNDISPKCLKIMKDIGLKALSFDIDTENEPFPFEDQHFDCVIALATIEHIANVDHFLKEIYRIINQNGYFFISAPNYCGLLYLIPFLLSGKTFHDPMSPKEKYEFYAHVKYFTYRTLIEFVSSFGFYPETVYLPTPKCSTNFLKLKSIARPKAVIFRFTMKTIYHLFSPRWASEPVICFSKKSDPHINYKKMKKIVL